MNKSQLISAVAEEVNLSKVDVKKVVDTLFAQLANKLNEGEKVVLSGFGVFSIANSPERIGRNPRTGVEVKIPARRNVKFRSNMDIE